MCTQNMVSVSEEAVGELKKKYQRDINCLSDPDRNTRKRALKRLQDDFFDEKGPMDSSKVYFFHQFMEKVLVENVICDQVEKCRELGLEIVYDFLEGNLPKSESRNEDDECSTVLASCIKDTTSDLVGVCSKRIGVLPFAEESEELRLKMLEILTLLVKTSLCGDTLHADMGKLVTTLSRALTDAAPYVKQQCATCVVQLSKSEILKPSIHLYMKQLFKPLTDNMFHQRAKVRQVTLCGIGAVITSCGTACDQEVFYKLMSENILPALSKISRDNSANVRIELLKQASVWIAMFPNTSYTKDLLLLLAAGLSDPALEVQKFALENIKNSGEVIKTQPDEEGTVEMSTRSGIYYPEPFESRPPAGIRSVFRSHLKEIIPLLLKQSEDWTTQGRLHALSLIRSVLVFAEDKISIYLGSFVPALCDAFRDDDKDVIKLAKDCSRLAGQYAKLDNILFYLLPKCMGTVKNEDVNAVTVQDSASARCGSVCMLSSVLLGVDISELKAESNVERIVEVLTHNSLCELGMESSALLGEMLRSSQDLILTLQTEKDENQNLPNNIFEKLLRLLLFLIGLSDFQDEELRNIASAANATIKELAKCSPFDDERQLISHSAKPILDSLLNEKGVVSSKAWLKSSIERRVFDQLIRKCIEFQISGNKMFYKDVFLILEKSCAIESDPELRLCMLSLLQSILADDFQFNLNGIEYSDSIVFETLMPNLIWRVGRVASTIRKIAMFCLGTFLGKLSFSGNAQKMDWLVKESVKIMPALKSLLDDMEADTRMFTCQCLGYIFKIHVSQTATIDASVASEIYHPIVSRFDDSNDRVRIASCEALAQLILSAEKHVLNGTAVRYIADSCFVHLDDQDTAVQEAVYKVLEVIIKRDIDTEMVISLAKKERTRHRSPQLCDQLISLS